MPRRIAAFVVAALLVAGLALAVLWRDKGPGVLRVANQKGQVRAMMLAAGVLDGAPYKVEWSEFPAAQPLLEAVASGAADLGLAADAPFIFAYESGAPVKGIAVQKQAQPAAEALSVMVKAGSPIRSAADLVGRTVATTRGSIGHHLLLQALERTGIPAAKVKITFLSPADAKAAFDSGAIDAWSVWSPYTNVAIKEGARVVADGEDYDPPLSVDIANAGAIEPKRALLADFLKREARALQWAHDRPDAFAAVLSRETGLPLDIARASFARNNRLAAPIDDALVAREREIVGRYAKAGYIKGDRDVAAAFDKSFSH
jgi:sulfonate transport system substrate-binding protein